MATRTKSGKKSREEGKGPAGSRVRMTTIVMPEDTNKFGSIFGGRVMEWIDKAAAVSALRHCRMNVVTASVDHLDFLFPIHLGDIVHLHASVNYVHRSSMEIGVQVLSEDPKTGRLRHTCSAYLTMVGLDDRGRPGCVPQLIPKTREDCRRQKEGERRRRSRIAFRRKRSAKRAAP